MAGITRVERERRDALYEQGLKQCNTCADPLPLDQFAPRADGYRGLNGTCRGCKNDQVADYQRRNPEKVAARVRRWNATNRARSHEIAKRYRDSHSLAERVRKGHVRAVARDGDADRIHPEKLLAHWDIEGIDPARCYYTGLPLGDNWHLDHMTPLSRGGLHRVDNLVPCCASVNMSKGKRTADEYLADLAEGAS
ncbi:HNH endonuclease [Gordonia sp. KTR9]|uniref:HNH endonuclease n=1 Tax=Gordonia sp. KTR9 TaxID=337191 RepID=UPI00027DDEB2|nr:HNH endonuclease [Gordonia sp. KTR9]AFR50019.1 hypothetical protein KTR9_3384 [Gordonia sp. KTR9]